MTALSLPPAALVRPALIPPARTWRTLIPPALTRPVLIPPELIRSRPALMSPILTLLAGLATCGTPVPLPGRVAADCIGGLPNADARPRACDAIALLVALLWRRGRQARAFLPGRTFRLPSCGTLRRSGPAVRVHPDRCPVSRALGLSAPAWWITAIVRVTP
ncbi:hypothetical protein J2S43_007429 [Catenuloplanes nepalensis]|uniref:Uncharacterized protein n=1 Tax=Catenuloplanes nepalensis TaxID=587533 RepID=A0ABT9N5E0_9ACTN|nr:hypothetical protein [Catenuloplanes nepalensis]MDP9798917.1 hypothetical protein [Catenuloplanes nepalensis]